MLKWILLFLCSLPVFSSCFLCLPCLSSLLPSFVSMATHCLHLPLVSPLPCVFIPQDFLRSLSSLVPMDVMFSALTLFLDLWSLCLCLFLSHCIWIQSCFVFSFVFEPSYVIEDSNKIQTRSKKILFFRQGINTVEDYTVQFCALANCINWKDAVLKDLFCHGLWAHKITHA